MIGIRLDFSFPEMQDYTAASEQNKAVLFWLGGKFLRVDGNMRAIRFDKIWSDEAANIDGLIFIYLLRATPKAVSSIHSA